MIEKNEFEELAKEFCKKIERLKAEDPDLSYLECIVDVCSDENIELETIKPMISKSIRDKIEYEAMSMNLLKYKNNTLL